MTAYDVRWGMMDTTDGEDVCTVCDVDAEERECADCGAVARVIDCGHYAQPAEIAASAYGVHDYVCEDCEMVRSAVPHA